MLSLFKLLEGIVLLTLGRKLFWLFVAVLGFEFGLLIAGRLGQGESELITIAIALGIGLLGAVLALMLQSFVVALAGFFAGGYVAVTMLQVVGVELALWEWVIFGAGGIFGVMFVIALFDWALIILSSLNGAQIIAELVLPRNGILTLFLVLVLCLVGVSLQAGLWRTERRKR